MSERKVLNKYYPPDFDPTKIPKLRLPKNRNFGIRLMAPFNMRCNTCGEYIYKGKKFNSQKETVEDKNYLGLHIFRFYIKCPRCIAVIAFRTDPETTDYVLEAGATRNFEALRTAEQLAIKEEKEKEEELKNNPMKVLENRSLKSQQEIEMLEKLEELRQIRRGHNAVNLEDLIKEKQKSAKELAEELARKQEEEDEQFAKAQFCGVRRLTETSSEDNPAKKPKLDLPKKCPPSSGRSTRDILKNLVVKKSAGSEAGNKKDEKERKANVAASVDHSTTEEKQSTVKPGSGLANIVGYGDDSNSSSADDD